MYMLWMHWNPVNLTETALSHSHDHSIVDRSGKQRKQSLFLGHVLEYQTQAGKQADNQSAQACPSSAPKSQPASRYSPQGKVL